MSMTSEERFAQIESLLLAAAERIFALQQQTESTQRQVDANSQAIAHLTRDMRESIEDLVQISTDTILMVAENSTAIRSMQTEVSGLQVANRRILRELRDRRRNEN